MRWLATLAVVAGCAHTHPHVHPHSHHAPDAYTTQEYVDDYAERHQERHEHEARLNSVRFKLLREDMDRIAEHEQALEKLTKRVHDLEKKVKPQKLIELGHCPCGCDCDEGCRK